MRNAEGQNLISGIPIAKESPTISHLLFADDSLFFCKAITEEAGQIYRILKDYEFISGQQINFDKSSIQFGHSVLGDTKLYIHNVLGIRQQGGMASYLGLPENISGAKTKVFAFIQEKLNERINGWTAKLLSKGGKEILIKSVLTALPTYIMSCYRIPKTIISKLNTAIAQFWWRNSETSKGIHWKKWNKVCKPKLEGGLGFRILEDFNSALLGKQLWRLIKYPESLFAKVMKGRYFKNGCPISNPILANSSYGWRSIASARPLTNYGKIKKVGDGKTIFVWKDQWIPDVQPRPAVGIEPMLYPNLTLDQFIDPQSRSWKEILLRQYFIPSDVLLILGIRIPRRLRPDYWSWHYTKTGNYSVKSGYNLQERRRNSEVVYNGPNFGVLYTKIWKLDCPTKIKHFVWQALSGCIAVKKNLLARGINCNISCDRCGSEEESINHVLFECPPATQTWALSPIQSPADIFPGNSIWFNLNYLFTISNDSGRKNIFPWLLWLLWKDRNNYCFTGTNSDPRELVIQAEGYEMEWKQANKTNIFHENNESSNISNLIWREVSFPMTINQSFSGFRCYADASWKASDTVSGLGWICFSDNAGRNYSGAKQTRRSLSALHSEVEAIIWAMKSLIDHQILQVQLATDCTDAQQILQQPDDWPEFLPYQEDYQRLKTTFNLFSINVIPRGLNYKADALARNARESTIITTM